MSSSIIILSIVYTIDIFLTIYHPFIPWLVLRQSNTTPIHIGQQVVLNRIYGDATQALLTGRIREISHYVQGFVIVIVTMDPQSFGSAIYLAIPRPWFALGPISSIRYRLSYYSLPAPQYTHFLDPSHYIYHNSQLRESPTGSRTYRRSRWCHQHYLISSQHLISSLPSLFSRPPKFINCSTHHKAAHHMVSRWQMHSNEAAHFTDDSSSFSWTWQDGNDFSGIFAIGWYTYAFTSFSRVLSPLWIFLCFIFLLIVLYFSQLSSLYFSFLDSRVFFLYF